MLNELREHFSTLSIGMRPLQSVPAEYITYTFYDGTSYGVAFPYNGDKPISQRFANAQLVTKEYIINGVPTNYLILRSFKRELYYEFATVCAQFIDPGRNGEEREAIMNDPTQWWMNWRELLGNAITDKYCYSVIAEMLALDYLRENGHNVIWHSADAGSHDIESTNDSFEVKSTLKRYGATITVSGQHQLKSTKPLYLMFCRMERSNTGLSIDDLVVQLTSHGYPAGQLEEELASMGYEIGTMERNQRYRVLEKRLYTVDNTFPKIIDASFVNGHLPAGVLQISYVIDLEALPYTNW